MSEQVKPESGKMSGATEAPTPIAAQLELAPWSWRSTWYEGVFDGMEAAYVAYCRGDRAPDACEGFGGFGDWARSAFLRQARAAAHQRCGAIAADCVLRLGYDPVRDPYGDVLENMLAWASNHYVNGYTFAIQAELYYLSNGRWGPGGVYLEDVLAYREARPHGVYRPSDRARLSSERPARPRRKAGRPHLRLVKAHLRRPRSPRPATSDKEQNT